MTNKLTALEVDAQTGIIIERELTADEITERKEITAQQEQQLAEAIAKVAARQSALAKLAALGLTEAEIAAL
jgi:DNA-binding NarL/FixJ family response regulator